MTNEERLGLVRHMWRLAYYVCERTKTPYWRQLTGPEIQELAPDVRDAVRKFRKLLYHYVKQTDCGKDRIVSMGHRSGILSLAGCNLLERTMAAMLWCSGNWNLIETTVIGNEMLLCKVVGVVMYWKEVNRPSKEGGRPCSLGRTIIIEGSVTLPNPRTLINKPRGGKRGVIYE